MPDPPRAPAGDADRERIIGLLREHYAQGRLDDAELDRRVGIVLSAEFTDQAAAAVAGLPTLAVRGSDRKVRRRGHGQAAGSGAGWVPTGERFRDPTSKVVMRVWIDPSDGTDSRRHYLPDDET